MKPRLTPLIGIYRGIIIGFLRWCEMDFVHPQYGALVTRRAGWGAALGFITFWASPGRFIG